MRLKKSLKTIWRAAHSFIEALERFSEVTSFVVLSRAVGESLPKLYGLGSLNCDLFLRKKIFHLRAKTRKKTECQQIHVCDITKIKKVSGFISTVKRKLLVFHVFWSNYLLFHRKKLDFFQCENK